MSMKKLVRFLAIGLTQIFFVQFQNLGVFVGAAHGLVFILRVKGFTALIEDFLVGMMERLTASGNTPARTGHYLNGMILGRARTHLIQQLPRVPKFMGYRDFNHCSVNID